MNTNVPTLSNVESLNPSTIPTPAERLDALRANAVITIEDVEMPIVAPYKEFKTGSKGFYASSKIDMGDGRRYQVGLTITRIGSKNE